MSITIDHTCSEDLGISIVAPNGVYYPVKYPGTGDCSCTEFGGTRTDECRSARRRAASGTSG
ncbi:hypothetical protein AB0M43_07505 [Longispora sp. NPDC051575]|uniref:hypothetical protein n=1 Tax=Longispora sp. NPDC051575 TaxID=3154943 RepID=UPI00341D81E0